MVNGGNVENRIVQRVGRSEVGLVLDKHADALSVLTTSSNRKKKRGVALKLLLKGPLLREIKLLLSSIFNLDEGLLLNDMLQNACGTIESCSTHYVRDYLVLVFARETDEAVIRHLRAVLDEGLKDLKIALAGSLYDEGGLAVLTLARVVNVELGDCIRGVLD